MKKYIGIIIVLLLFCFSQANAAYQDLSVNSIVEMQALLKAGGVDSGGNGYEALETSDLCNVVDEPNLLVSTYIYNATATDTVDGLTIVATGQGGSGRWKLCGWQVTSYSVPQSATVAGQWRGYELSANGAQYQGVEAADSITTISLWKFPNSYPTSANTIPILGAATGSPLKSTISYSVLGTSVLTALTTAVGSAGGPVVNGGALGTPSSGNLANCTGAVVSSMAIGAVTGLGTNVGTALTNTLGSAAGVSTTIYSGTQALGTTQIASAGHTAFTVTASNVATTDVVMWGFASDPTALAGYTPATTGMLTIIVWPTTGQIHIWVCNNTSAAITPGAVTLNLRVVR